MSVCCVCTSMSQSPTRLVTAVLCGPAEPGRESLIIALMEGGPALPSFLRLSFRSPPLPFQVIISVVVERAGPHLILVPIMVTALDTQIVAIDSFDPVGAQYMRSVFPGVLEPEHVEYNSKRWDAVGLLVGGAPVTAQDIEQSPNLKYIVRHGAGYDAVDIDACRKRGIIVCNCPGVNVSYLNFCT
jgi:hypothetical protein